VRADFRLGQLGLGEGRSHGVLAGGLVAGAVVVAIVGVEPIEDRGETKIAGLRLAEAVELVLAEVAAVVGILRVARVLELTAGDEHVPHAERPAERFGPLALARRQARGDGGERDGAEAELLDGNLEHERAVGAAGEGDQRGG